MTRVFPGSLPRLVWSQTSVLKVHLQSNGGNKERRVGVGGDEEDKERNRVGYYRGGMEEERKTYQLGRQAEAAMSIMHSDLPYSGLTEAIGGAAGFPERVLGRSPRCSGEARQGRSASGLAQVVRFNEALA
ncbi:hypothetical protein C4D60_Mb11t07240 [Musa balbisiana]|uniref:Uncharacterized protein n=1 Tax=Musa balbisiana TaxID=52838 RepID=A0A4S8J2C7_MUSBA|nr:hypothetical protein C4D60_Mb11t07240 [Musa balbisiana]